jgi:hypothetical protein
MKWLHWPRVARSLAYGRETVLEIEALRRSGATLRPPGDAHDPDEVTSPPVRVQFISCR